MEPRDRRRHCAKPHLPCPSTRANSSASLPSSTTTPTLGSGLPATEDQHGVGECNSFLTAQSPAPEPRPPRRRRNPLQQHPSLNPQRGRLQAPDRHRLQRDALHVPEHVPPRPRQARYKTAPQAGTTGTTWRTRCSSSVAWACRTPPR